MLNNVYKFLLTNSFVVVLRGESLDIFYELEGWRAKLSLII